MTRALTAVATTVVTAGTVVGAPGLVAAAPAPEAAVPWATPSFAGAAVPAVHRLDDTTPVRADDLAAVPGPPRTRAQARAIGLPDLPPRVTVPVAVHVVEHVIEGTHRGERSPAGPRKVRRVLAILNDGSHGAQAPGSARTRYHFSLRHIDDTRREGWYHAALFGPRDRRMRRALHRGGRGTLNLSINGGGTRAQPVLGWSRFPWQYRRSPRLDGVAVNWRALPGGTLRHHRLGDTVIHETGHWMGLFHTFQGGCAAPGDRVADTPAEATPDYRCHTRRDTCRDDHGLDPVRDFMDYSYDRCLDPFTPGQAARMDRSFATYRR